LFFVAVAVVILAVAVLHQSSGTTTTTSPPVPDGGPSVSLTPPKIVPASVFAVNLDGSAAHTLTNRPLAFDARPAWSPDGTRLTSNTANDGFPAWSPDGTKLAFVSDRDGQPGIWVMGADGSGPSRLVSGPATPMARPAWAPDGRSIAFASDRDGGNLDIFVADAPATGVPG